MPYIADTDTKNNGPTDIITTDISNYVIWYLKTK